MAYIETFLWVGREWRCRFDWGRVGGVSTSLEEILLEEHQKREPKPERGAVAIAG